MAHVRGAQVALNRPLRRRYRGPVTINDPDFTEFMKGRGAVGQAYVSGDADPLTAISTEHEPASFFPPPGGIVQGAAEVVQTNQQGAEQFLPGSETQFEVLHSEASGDLGYQVAVQHAEVRRKGADEPVPMHLRITEIFRREDGRWKLVHRHADPNASPPR